MSIDTTITNSAQQRVVDNFRVSGSNLSIVYEKYVTDSTINKLIVSNSSATDALQFFYTGSGNEKFVITSGSVVLDKNTPIIIPRTTSSKVSAVELTLSLKTDALNVEPFESDVEGNQLFENLYFNVAAITASISTQSSAYVSASASFARNRPGFPANALGDALFNEAFDRTISQFVNTQLYEINTSDLRWRDVTNTLIENGLGYDYISSNAGFVRFGENQLRRKKNNLIILRDFIESGIADYATVREYFFGEKRGEKFNLFANYFYYALNDGTNAWRGTSGIFTFDVMKQWMTTPNAAPNQGAYGIPKVADYARAFTQSGTKLDLGLTEDLVGTDAYVYGLLTKWISLIDDILAPTTNLSRIIPPITNTFIGVDENSRVNINVGTIDIDIAKTTYSISDAILSASKELINLKTAQFFDENREYKTLLNLIFDQQYLVEAWRPLLTDSSSIQLKLFEPLSTTVALYDDVYLSRDFAASVIDTVNIDPIPEIDSTPYLRPLNTDVRQFNNKKTSIDSVTLSSMNLDTGSMGAISGSNITYEDRVFNKWLTSDFDSSELNIDFSDYANFVTFGSAKKRLDSFKQKLISIESLQTSASISGSDTVARMNAVEIEYIKRNFDPYEQFLYFAPQSTEYSASAYYVDGGYEYHATGSWPKDANNKPLKVTQVTDWFTVQSAIAERYDEFNQNYLIKHLPQYIQEDEESEEFLQFISMFGHIMDNLKVYVDQYPYIYSTSPNPFTDLSMDQVYEVAKSFGLSLPNAYSLEALQDFVSSVYDEDDSRSLVAETWKRILHSAPMLTKAKGSRTSMDLVLNSYGINTPALQIKEASHPTYDDYIKSDEYAYTVKFVSSSANRISIPFVSSSVSASTFQVRFRPGLRNDSTLLSGDNGWAIDLVPHPSSSFGNIDNIINTSASVVLITKQNDKTEYGRIEIVSGSARTVIASSSYFRMFGEDYTHIMLRSQSQDITIIQTDGDQILFQQSASVSWGPLWQNTRLVHLGGSGSIRLDTFDGYVDEVHVWADNITDTLFINQAYDPGSYYGTYYTSSYTSLYTHLAFSQPLASITQSAANESPYVSSSIIGTIPAVGFLTSSYERTLRSIKQFVPTVGARAYSNSKVKVAPPPVFNEQFVYDDDSYILHRRKSIKLVEEKRFTGGLDTIWFAVSPTDFINQTIMRSMGLVDTNYLIGSPRKLKKDRYLEVDELLNFYLEHYNQAINPSEYIRFYKNLSAAPTEYIQYNIPARANLLDGIVIESPVLDRKRVDVQQSFRVDGANTITFEKFVAGSGSANVGAYQFDANYDTFVQTDNTILTKQILQYVNSDLSVQNDKLYLAGSDTYPVVTSSLVNRNSAFATITSRLDTTQNIGPVSSLASGSLPKHKTFLQNITTNTSSSYEVLSSFADPGSGIGFVTTIIDGAAREPVPYTGYNRNAYKGIIGKIDSEENTLTPFYAINPVSDFSDVGTTTYFNNNTGIHWFVSRLVSTNLRVNNVLEPKYSTTPKRLYKAKLDISGEVESPVSDLYAKISLIDPEVSTDYPGRDSVTINTRTYTSASTAGSTANGYLKMANIFSIYAIQGAAGLRVRFYPDLSSQNADTSRPYTTPPTITSNVLFDGILDGTTNLVYPYTLVQTNNSTVYFSVENTTSTNDLTSDIKIYYFEYEPSSLVPVGYLPRHYKFNRHEVIAQKRRNYLGCKLVYCPEGCTDDVLRTKTYVGKNKNTITTQIESESPVIIFPSGRTAPVVRNPGSGGGSSASPPLAAGNPSPLDNALGFGGKGKLDDKKR